MDSTIIALEGIPIVKMRNTGIDQVLCISTHYMSWSHTISNRSAITHSMATLGKHITLSNSQMVNDTKRLTTDYLRKTVPGPSVNAGGCFLIRMETISAGWCLEVEDLVGW